MTVTRVYSDNDISATNGKGRPDFEAMLAARPTAIVTWHQDRLLRLTRDLERMSGMCAMGRRFGSAWTTLQSATASTPARSAPATGSPSSAEQSRRSQTDPGCEAWHHAPGSGSRNRLTDGTSNPIVSSEEYL